MLPACMTPTQIKDFYYFPSYFCGLYALHLCPYVLPFLALCSTICDCKQLGRLRLMQHNASLTLCASFSTGQLIIQAERIKELHELQLPCVGV